MKNDIQSASGGVGAFTRIIESLTDLEGDELLSLLSVAKSETFDEDEEIYAEASEGQDFLFILEGNIEATRETPLGVQTVAHLGAGDLCGEISLIDGKERSTGVRSTSSGQLLRFELKELGGLMQRDDHVETAVLRIFCRSLVDKLRQANGVMAEIMSASGDSKRARAGGSGSRREVDEEQKRSLLRRHGLAHEDLDALKDLLEGEHFPSGSEIFVEGDHSDTLYIVAEGAVRISRHLPGLGEEALAILGPGDVFGEMAWIDDSPRSADAIAHTGGCTVLGIGRDSLEGRLDSDRSRHNRFLKLMCQVLARKIRQMNEQLVAYRTMAFF